MRNKRLIIVLAGLIGLLNLNAEAQNGFNMPLSQFGVGSSELPFNMPMATRMGGAVYTMAGNNYVNPFNPASYASVQMESFVFDMGMNIQMSRLRAGTESQRDADGNLSYLAVAMPITRWWKLAGGLMPYSQVDYESVSQQTGEDFGTVKTVYDGTGGVSQVFLGSAFNIIGNGREGRRLQAGFNVNYLTGRIHRAISYRFMGNDSTFYMNKRRYKQTSIHNVVFDFGMQYWQPIGEKFTLAAGVVYKPYRSMNVDDLAMIYTYHSSDESLVDTVFPLPGEDPEFESNLELSHTFGIGLSFERNNQWKLAFDATFAKWNDIKYLENPLHSIFGVSSLRYGPYSRYALGFEKMGNMDAAKYAGRISWSAGVHIQNGVTYLQMNGQNQRMDEWGVGVGMTLPMRKGRSLFTLSVGYSSLGTKDVVQRNSLTFGMAVSSCERWFVKRKYN